MKPKTPSHAIIETAHCCAGDRVSLVTDAV
jgi:hypothetical protein